MILEYLPYALEVKNRLSHNNDYKNVIIKLESVILNNPERVFSETKVLFGKEIDIFVRSCQVICLSNFEKSSETISLYFIKTEEKIKILDVILETK